MSSYAFACTLFAVFVFMFLVNSGIIAQNAVYSAKCQKKFTLSATAWLTSIITIGCGLGAALLFVWKQFGQPDAVMLFLFILLIIIGSWMGMLKVARMIVERYYPHATFCRDQDMGIDQLGSKRPGEGWIMDLY